MSRPPGDDPVGAVLAALADPTRRSVFADVAHEGPITATTLAATRDVSRQAVAKHLERLADAGLVTAEKVGRETRWSATPEPLADTVEWFDSVGSAWDARLRALADRARGDRESDPRRGRMGD